MQARVEMTRNDIKDDETVYSAKDNGAAGSTPANLTISGKIGKNARVVAVANSTVTIQADTIIDETVRFELRMNASLKFSSKPSDTILKNIQQSFLAQITFPENGVTIFYKTDLLKARNYRFVNNNGTDSHFVAASAPELTNPKASM